MPQACCLNSCEASECVQLTDREFSVCRTICEADHPITFGKIKKSSALHQEVVSRIVRRLLIHGLVRKSDDGYLGQCGQ